MRKGGVKIVTQNRRAYHEYEILDKYEAGIILTGTEIKSIRLNKVSINEAYCHIRDNKVIIVNMHIAKYDKGTIYNHEETRNRDLLLHKSEVRKLLMKVKTDGLTIIPMQVYLKGGLCKVEIALARGKKLYDKRKDLKEEELKRESNKR